MPRNLQRQSGRCTEVGTSIYFIDMLHATAVNVCTVACTYLRGTKGHTTKRGKEGPANFGTPCSKCRADYMAWRGASYHQNSKASQSRFSSIGVVKLHQKATGSGVDEPGRCEGLQALIRHHPHISCSRVLIGIPFLAFEIGTQLTLEVSIEYVRKRPHWILLV